MAEKMALITVAEDVPPAARPASTPRPPRTTDPQASPNLRSISLESRTSHVADVCVCVYCNTY